jgi:Ca2+-binding EF-hand superfamily protein
MHIRVRMAGPRDKEHDMKTTLCTVILLGGLAAVPAFAFGGGGPMGMEFDFAAADADGDGKISRDEMEAARAARVKAIDADGDGLITVEEMTVHMQAQQAERLARMAQHMMIELDADGDGKLALDEMQSGRGHGRMFDRMDANEDGFLDEDEIDEARERMHAGRHDRSGMGGGMGEGMGGGMGGGWGWWQDN